MSGILSDLSSALAQLAFSWIMSGLLFALVFHPVIMGPYRWARFRYFNLPRKFSVWLLRSWRLILMWPSEVVRLVSAISGDARFCYDEDRLYHIPACRLIGFLKPDNSELIEEFFYQIGDRYIRGVGGRFFFCKSEQIVVEMMTNPNWINPDEADQYMSPSKIAKTPVRVDSRKWRAFFSALVIEV